MVGNDYCGRNLADTGRWPLCERKIGKFELSCGMEIRSVSSSVPPRVCIHLLIFLFHLCTSPILPNGNIFSVDRFICATELEVFHPRGREGFKGPGEGFILGGTPNSPRGEILNPERGCKHATNFKFIEVSYETGHCLCGRHAVTSRWENHFGQGVPGLVK